MEKANLLKVVHTLEWLMLLLLLSISGEEDGGHARLGGRPRLAGNVRQKENGRGRQCELSADVPVAGHLLLGAHIRVKVGADVLVVKKKVVSE